MGKVFLDNVHRQNLLVYCENQNTLYDLFTNKNTFKPTSFNNVDSFPAMLPSKSINID